MARLRDYEDDGYGYEDPTLDQTPEGVSGTQPVPVPGIDADYSGATPSEPDPVVIRGQRDEIDDPGDGGGGSAPPGGPNPPPPRPNPPPPPPGPAPNPNPGPAPNQFDPEAWLRDLSRRSNVPVEETDLANLRGKKEEDRAQFQRDLEAQYRLRARPTASAGGIGGSADLDQNGQIDPGWVKGPGGQYTFSPPVSGTQPVPRTRTGAGASEGGPSGRSSIPSSGPSLEDILNQIGVLGKKYGGPAGPGVFPPPVQQVGQDPFSEAITGGLMDLLGNFGQSPLANDLDATLRGIIGRGGAIDQSPADKAARFEAARQPIDAMRKAQLANVRGTLADRGLLSEPGMPQGSEIGAMGRLEENLAPYYATAAQNLAGQEAEGDQARLSEALQLATGLSRQQSEVFLNTLESATDRQRVLSEIALGTLDRNILWNRFLADLGMERGQVMESIQQGRIENLTPLLMMFQQFIQQVMGGYI